MRFHKDGTTPAHNGAIFVYGSNLAGRHGRGAAREAYLHWGAQMGVGEGLVGRSYAIPTKDRQLRVRPLGLITDDIKRFLAFTEEHPRLLFFVTRIGCELAGYRDSEIAPHFRGALSNCSFAEQWKEYLT